MANLINPKIFKKFFKSSAAGGIVLLLCVALSLIIANTSIAEDFNALLHHKLGFETPTLHFDYTLLSWINDGLMALFFLLVGLEIKREIIEGELSSVRLAALPVLAALGGVVVPAIIYILFNQNNGVTAAGWGIPMATDIAFALGILSLLGKRVPAGLKIFLAALAIVDDLLAILVIALFYSADIQFIYLAYASGIIALLVTLNRLGVKSLVFYLVSGVILWYFIHHSGIHATIAGVITALTIPTNKSNKTSPLEKLEHFLSTPVNFIIMPIFAIANTNITVEIGMFHGLTGTMGLGIVLGLFVGKPIGIFIMSWVSVKLKIAQLPANVKWPHVLGLGLLGGIGFTMSIFIALLSFNESALQAEAKFAVLIASLLAGITGFIFLSKYNKNKSRNNNF